MSISFFARLEPRTRTDLLERGLAAPVYDACWLLARQWQLGELGGDDGGSPISVRHRAESWPIVTYQPYPADPALPAPDPISLGSISAPLEAVVEAQPVKDDATWTTRLRVDTGRELLHHLREAGAADWIGWLIDAFGLDPPDPSSSLDAGARLRLLAAGRIPDGQPIYSELSTADLDALSAFAGHAVDAAFRTAVKAWLTWCRAAMFEPAGPDTAWSSDRFEYNFRLSAPRPDSTIVLDAVEHPGGLLDWYSFSAQVDPTGDPASVVHTLDRTLVPTRVTFPGMPNARWWECEDAIVDLGSVEAHPADLARLALLEFGLVYGNDHFIVPVQIDVGHLCRNTDLLVTDTFGVTILVEPAAKHAKQDQRWTMFTLESDDASATRDLFVLPPTSPQQVDGPTVEDVALLRDEMANLAWAVERSFEGEDGVAVDRARRSRRPPVTNPPTFGAALRYVLGTTVPPHWFPLVPDAAASARGPRLRLTEMEYSTDPDAQPSGRLLHIGQFVEDEEIPREGLHLRRDRVLARWIDGTPVAWTRNQTSIGRGEGSSGLRFDIVHSEPPPS
jgi:hypothetical protein